LPLVTVKKNIKVLPGLFAGLEENAAKSGKADAKVAINACATYTAIAKEANVYAESYLVQAIPILLKTAASKEKTVREAATAAVQAITSSFSGYAVESVLPYLFAGAAVEEKGETRVLALKTLAAFSDFSAEVLGYCLPKVVPQVTQHMADLKKDVKAAAIEAMKGACDVIGNKDIEHMTDSIVQAIVDPEQVKEIMHKLAGCVFVQSVQSPALAMVVPLLLRGLRYKLTATKRQAAVVIDNMSKLVDDPLDAAPFLPELLPAITNCAENLSDPEARGVVEKATAQLKKLEHFAAEMKGGLIDHAAVLKAVEKQVAPNADNKHQLNHIATLICCLMGLKHFDTAHWDDVLQQLAVLTSKDKATAAVAALVPVCKEMVKVVLVVEDDDDAEELCNCQFTLAYGTKILLHNTIMRLKRGNKYGLLGGNDSGKTTLMRSIANGSVEGFPDPSTVRTVFVEADILGELSHLSCVDYIMSDERCKTFPREEVLTVMHSVGFREDGKAKPNNAVSTLSGGWRMKLALARAMLQKADILLMDEPTNHLDVINVAWVKSYINSLKTVTCIMVSHDAKFLNECCTDIIHIDRLKLHQYKGNLDSFIAKNPEAKSFFSLKESKLTFKFPQPGPIDGVKSRTKALMKMSHCDFTYPGNDKPTLFDISIQVSMASRVGCVGENGAGKSTMIKVLTGEVVPQTGEVWKHPNARVAYVAQHAFHHIEAHLDKTPNEYIRWRYANGEDKESLVKVSMILTPEEEALQKASFEVVWVDEGGVTRKANKVVNDLIGGRRESREKKEYEYEVKYMSGEEGWLGLKILTQRGFAKAVKAVDLRIAQRSGLFIRTLSSSNVEKHLNDVGLEPEFATHYRMSALSGGQKVKVVMAASLWNQPHILILDEPTNYLDRESLGALAKAIETYEGGVVIISHNNEFVSTLCTEEWQMDAGHLTTKGDSGWMDRQDDKIAEQAQITEMTDAMGNTTEIKVKKTLSKRDEKAKIKIIQKKIKDGLDLDTDEEELAIEKELI
jgi:elongation factor 3